MSDNELQKAINRWRSLPMEERQRRHLEAIPRHVANSMAMAGEPVDEEWLLERLARRIWHHSLRFSVDGTTRRKNFLLTLPRKNSMVPRLLYSFARSNERPVRAGIGIKDGRLASPPKRCWPPSA